MLKINLIALCISFTISQLNAQQLDRKITLQANKKTIENILNTIAGKYDVSFSYINNQLPDKRLTVSFVETPLSEVLEDLFHGSKLSFSEHEDKIIIKKGIARKEEPVKVIDAAPSDSTTYSKDDANNYTQILSDSLKNAAVNSDSIEIPRLELVSEDTVKEEVIQVQDSIETQTTTPSNPAIKITYVPGLEAVDKMDSIENPEKLSIPPKIYRKRIFHAGILYPISNNGSEAGRYVNNFSIHLLSGYSGGVNGFEYSSVANVVIDTVSGLQLAGISNVIGSRLTGAQFGGVTNIVKGDATGFQVAGVTNIVKGNQVGLQVAGVNNTVLDTASAMQVSGLINVSKGANEFGQIAGFMNISKSVNGPQIAGFMNIQKQPDNRKSGNGVQISGFMNRAYKLKGLQLSGVTNYATYIEGAQISGLVNKAHKVKGLQLGLINVTDYMHGASIGLLNIVKQNGYFDLELFYADDFSGNATIKIGSKYFHNLFGISYDFKNGERWAYGYGFGSQFGENMFRLNTDLMSYYVMEQDFPNGFFRDYKLNLLNKFRLLGSIHFGDFGIFAGPVLNVMVSKVEDNETNQLQPASSRDPFPPTTPLIDNTSRFNTNVKMWVGYNVGIRF